MKCSTHKREGWKFDGRDARSEGKAKAVKDPQEASIADGHGRVYGASDKALTIDSIARVDIGRHAGAGW